jgi:hypothetical protein
MYIINDTEMLAYADTYFRPFPEKYYTCRSQNGTAFFFLSSSIHTTEKEAS